MSPPHDDSSETFFATIAVVMALVGAMWVCSGFYSWEVFLVIAVVLFGIAGFLRRLNQ